MYGFMTGNTKGNPIRDIKSKFWMLGIGFDVMSMNGYLSFSTMLTGVVVSFVHRFAPQFQFGLVDSSLISKRTTINVSRRVFTLAFSACQPLALAGAINGILVAGYKFILTFRAYKSPRRLFPNITLHRAKARLVGSIGLNSVFISTGFTNLLDSCISVLTTNCVKALSGTIFLVFGVGVKFLIANQTNVDSLEADTCHDVFLTGLTSF